MSRRLTAAAPLLFAACYAVPPLDAPRTPSNVVKAVLAHDLSTAGFSAMAEDVGEVLGLLAKEPARAHHVPATTGRIVVTGLGDGGRVTERLEDIAAHEARRHPAFERLGRLVAPLRADDVRHTAAVLLTPAAPLADIDDVRHRTDPNDDSPEPGLWARVRRRLRL
ncbi:MAG: hypothetical protein JNK78_17010 [Planctomycetes bacterium]|nr:hypothetical protein [Planctomycetota bacterium]